MAKPKAQEPWTPPPACSNCGGIHIGSSRCPYLERTGPCEICETETVYACSDCAIEFKQRVVRVCTNPECRDKHEAKVHGKTRPTETEPKGGADA